MRRRRRASVDADVPRGQDSGGARRVLCEGPHADCTALRPPAGSVVYSGKPTQAARSPCFTGRNEGSYIVNTASPGIDASTDLAALKARQRLAWASGDYAVIGTTLQIVGELLADACDLGWEERVCAPILHAAQSPRAAA
jgi:hypothetical protein